MSTIAQQGQQVVHEHVLKSFEQVVADEERYIGRKLSPEELDAVKERLNYFKLHQGHEAAHSQMLLIIIFGLLFSQIIVNLWKKYHINSYNLATLLGLWIIPLLMAIQNGFIRFIVIWSLWSLVNSYIVKMALESPMKHSTPKFVYYWYQKVYDVSYLLGGFGYFICLLAFFHLPIAFGFGIDGEAHVFLTGITIMFYALYFGTLGRDFVDRLSEIMATTMGYHSKKGFPQKHLRQNTCAICGETTLNSTEKLHTLNCNHVFHEICIRGWTIVGKKDICPYCKEKVDLNAFKTNPWDTTQVFFLNLLDFVRYILVWNPIAFAVIHQIIRLLGLH